MSKPNLLIDDAVFQKVMYWVNKSAFEVSGLGIIKRDTSGALRVVDAMLLPQKNTATHTDIDADAVCKAMFDMKDSEGELRWWWHSHVGMPVFWSGTDHDTIKQLGKEGWIVATVFNQKNEMRSAVYAKGALVCPWAEKPSDIFYDELLTEISRPVSPDVAKWEEDYTKKVQNTLFPTQATSFTQGRWPAIMGTSGNTGGTTNTAFWQMWTPAQLKQAFECKYASGRPSGMTKRGWTLLRKLTDASKEVLLKKSEEFHSRNDSSLETDAFGFTMGDWVELGDADYTKRDVEELTRLGFTAESLLTLAREQVTPVEVQHMISQGYTPSGVLRVALADKAATL